MQVNHKKISVLELLSILIDELKCEIALSTV